MYLKIIQVRLLIINVHNIIYYTNITTYIFIYYYNIIYIKFNLF